MHIDRLFKLQNAMGLVLAAFIAIAPVYWLVGVPAVQITATKLVLLAILLFLALVTLLGSRLKIAAAQISFTQIGALLVIATMVNLLNVVTEVAHIWPLVYILMLQVVVAVYFCSGGRLDRIVWVTATAITISCLAAIADRVLNLGIYVPGQSGERLFVVGFNDSRTGWSIGLAMHAVFFAWFVLRNPTSKLVVPLLLVIGLIVFAQVVSGGRSGLLASLVCFTFLLWRMSRRGAIVFLVGLALIGVWFVYQYIELIVLILRIDRLQTGADFSAGRLEQYVIAWNYLVSTSFLPQGTDAYRGYFQANGSDLQMHNVWVGLWLQYGVLVPMIMLAWVMVPIYRLRRHDPDLSVLLLIGLIPTVFEPSVIFVVVTNYIAWWLLFSYGLYLIARSDTHAKDQRSFPHKFESARS